MFADSKVPASLAVTIGTAVALVSMAAGPIGWSVAGTIALNAARNGVLTWGALDISDKMFSSVNSKWETRKFNKTKLSSVPSGGKA